MNRVSNQVISKSRFCFVLAALLLSLCRPAESQQPKIPRIGVIYARSSFTEPLNMEAFRKGLRELGYEEGKNISVEYRYGEGRNDRLTNLAAEFVGLKVDVIVTGSTIAAVAAKKLTATVPIVMAGTADPVGVGLIDSLGHPGGNVTGLSSLTPELSGKQLELLKEAFPVSRVAVLFNGANRGNIGSLKQTEAAATVLEIRTQPLDVRDPKDYEAAFDAAAQQHANALLVLREPLNQTNLIRIVALASKWRLPAIYPLIEYVNGGGLMSYGVSSPDQWKRAASYVDKILKGAKPANLPVEQPTKFELVISLKTAKQIGLTIPPNVLARADKVIR